MTSANRTIRLLSGALLVAAMTFILSTCGGTGGTDFSGGGTGGTGISTGSITGFGSVVMNNTHYYTDNAVAPGFRTKKISKGIDRSGSGDRDVFRVGMVVTVRHSSGDNNATEIDYEPNLVGPIAAKDSGALPSIQVLGHTVVLDNEDLFSSLAAGNVVEISGFADSSGRIRATYLEEVRPAPMAGDTYTIEGFISDFRPADGTFAIGPLPGGAGITAIVSYTEGSVRDLPSGPANGMYVLVETRDTMPGSGGIRADHVARIVPRTEFSEGATVDLEGLATRVDSRSGNILSFEIEGKAVRTSDSTVFLGGNAEDIQPDRRVQAHGTEAGGILSAAVLIIR